MPDKKKNKNASESKRRKQQVSSRKQPESAVKQARVSRENKNVRRDNTRIAQQNPRRRSSQSKAKRILVACILIALGIMLFLMLFTFTAADLAKDATSYLNLFGYFGAKIAGVMLFLFGIAAFLFSAVCILFGVCSLFGKQIDVHSTSIVGMIVLIAGGAPLSALAFNGSKILENDPGGVYGTWCVSFATNYVSSFVFGLICIVVSIFGGLLVTDTSLKSFFLALWKFICWCGKLLFSALAAPFKNRPLPQTVEPAPVEDDSPSTESMTGVSFYEDTTSQLLDGKEEDLETRERRANEEEFTSSDLSDASVSENSVDDLPVDDSSAHDIADPVSENIACIPHVEDASADIDDPDGLLAMGADEVVENNVIEPEIVEKKESPKPAKSEALGDIMARIISSRPQKRSIKKRSISVPVIEPEFEPDSILTPEQICSIHKKPNESSTTSAKVLGNWKPRSINKKSSASSDKNAAPEQPTVALSDIHDATARKALSIPAPELPSHMTKDLLAQLQTEDLEIDVRHDVSATKIASTSGNVNSVALAETADLKLKNLDRMNKATLEAPAVSKKAIAESETCAALDDDDIKRKYRDKLNARKIENATAVPVSAELRALMEDAGFNYDKKKNSDYSDLAFDDFDKPRSRVKSDISLEEIISDNISPIDDDEDDMDSFDLPSSNQSAKNAQKHGAFVVAEEKKRASEDELDEAERARIQNMKQSEYEFPPLSLLHYDPSSQKGLDNEALRLYANKIEEKLAEYHIQGQVVQICPGPVVTRFEFQPAPGTKVSRIASLSDDLMMALEIKSVRILAPIPGKGVVGIEVPNEKRNTIFLKEIIASKQFSESKSILTVALGKDAEGEPVVSDLAKMPHLLVAGSTGSGKSVGINTMICSLLYNASPDDCKLILVDPKCLELSIYEGIPHLLVPPITTPAETAAALDWACDEMDERYKKLSALGVRNIKGYNEQLENPTLPKAIEAVRERDDDGNPKYQHMPYIVIVVDEFADLMMTSGKEIERSIARLAQKARAAGIHIILATQRPSTNVITGVIKANFPTRLAFRVFSYIDSRTILDQKGAESLLGMGDSLFLPPNTAVLQRVHGAFVSDDEVQSVVGFLAKQRAPEYNLDITTPKEDDSCSEDAMGPASSNDFDPLYDQALQIVAETRQASASFLQRRMSIGFNRAARIIEQMEREGVIGPQKGQKPREVLIQPI